ncbi:MAG: AMP-binding protein [Oscillospiraceae bacterium]|nr:AMP-binding protein [Oscillospiraceae bacterium]MDD7353535.1 AMP-binding protein [Oscillospiraceae bacterium]MDY3938338.1 AMP-binding protein [Oscillospiraceae bacterium]
MAETANEKSKILEIAQRIHELRDITGFTTAEMAEKTEVTEENYLNYEAGKLDFPFTFIHKCALAFGVEITDLLEGHSARLSSYTVTRKGRGQTTATEEGITIQNLAPMFRKKLAEPYWVRYEYSDELQKKPIHTTTHSGQEFDLVISGTLLVQVGGHKELLHEGDSIFYNSSTPHGMIAVDGKDCVFLAMVIASEDGFKPFADHHIIKEFTPADHRNLVCEKFIHPVEDENGCLKDISFTDADKFNFAFDIVDEIARLHPDKTAMVHVSADKTERIFTFKDIKQKSAQAANYFKSLGIKKGDRVMLVMKRHYQFWFAILGLHKLGAIVVPATNLLVEHDFDYRFNAGGISAIVCTADGDTAHQVDLAHKNSPTLKTKIIVNGEREGWHNFDKEFVLFSRKFERTADSACGGDPMLMFFTSGTTGYPKIATHNFKYPLGHFVTAKYWHRVKTDGLHFTIAETGWGKALWGKLYGQWLCEGAVFVYDFTRFDADDILPMFKKYNITTFCAPPTMYRMFIKDDLSKFDLSSIQYATTAGEALNPEVFYQFQKATGLKVMEGFGQTETTLTIANLYGMEPKPGSMGKPVPGYDIDIVDPDGNPVGVGESGEIVVRTDKFVPNGLFMGYYRDEEKTKEAWHDGIYHSGDVAWRDEDGNFWYVGRTDDVIKSSGYRIGPFEIENVIMELPYVLECGVSAAPDEIRGQVVKASIVLTKGTVGTDELKKEIQTYVKKKTAPYKYPRIVEFKESLPKTISGKIQRNKL